MLRSISVFNFLTIPSITSEVCSVENHISLKHTEKMGCKCNFVFQEMAILMPMQSNRTTAAVFQGEVCTVIYYKQKVPHIAGKSKLNYHPTFEYN